MMKRRIPYKICCIALMLVMLAIMVVQVNGYNAQNAVNYADTWWNGRNPNYFDYSNSGGDCANFVSQSLIAGGITFDQYTDSKGSIINCDNLDAWLKFKGYQSQEILKSQNPKEPTWFLPGDVAIFGDASDKYRHAVIAVTGDSNNYATANAHSYDYWHKSIQNFYDLNYQYDAIKWDRCTFYHISSTPNKFQIGDRVQVTSNLNVHTGPGIIIYPEISDPVYYGYAPLGSIGKIIEGPTPADGYIWWKVDYGEIEGSYAGWSVQDGLRKVTGEPVISSSLAVTQSPPYYNGNTITAIYTITNNMDYPFTFNVLTVGGRDPDGTVSDFVWRQSITLNPGESYNFQGSLTLNKIGNYHFFCAYRDPDGSWNTGIPTNSGVTNTLDISVTGLYNPPTAYIDSITPNPAVQGQTVTFGGHGTDPDSGDSITAYNWRSSINGQLSTSNSFSSSTLSAGTHTIYFKVMDSHSTWSSEVTRTLTVNPTNPPTAYIDSITPNPAVQGQTVTFGGHGTDPDSGDSITAYNWRSSINGQLSTSNSFSSSTLSAGTHTIYFKVMDGHSTWSPEVTSTLTMNSPTSITVTSPNGGESWQRGSTHTVTWSYTGNPGSTVKIELLKGGIPVGIATYSTPIGANGKGSYPWAISSTRAADTDYRIRVTSVSQPTISGTSNGDFTITVPTPHPPNIPSIPSGNSAGDIGIQYTYSTSATDPDGNQVKYTFDWGDSTSLFETPLVASGTILSASHSWASAGTYYVKAKATDSNGASSLAWSGSKIVTIQGTNNPTIIATAPTCGETWQPGTSHPVKWSYTGSPGSMVKVVLLKSGVAVGTATYSASIGSSGTGSYLWAISSGRASGTDYQILVQSTTQPSVNGTSCIFNIGGNPSSITVMSPNGGESWKRGTTQTVKWSYIGNPGSYVKIELLQGGTAVGTATYSTSLGTSGTGSYPWAISAGRAPGTNYRIRVTSVSQPTISDTSNGDFTITT